MKKFSFKKPDITFPKVKMPWGKSKEAEEAVEQPAEEEIIEKDANPKKRFSFKKPSMPWHKTEKEKPAEEEKAEDIQPAAQEQEPEVSTEAKSSFSLPKMPWKKDEPQKEAPKPEQPKPECPQELDQLRRQLAMWRWIAASCAFAALSAVLLLG